MTATQHDVTVGAAWMHAGLIVVLVVAFVFAALAVAAGIASARGKRAPQHDAQPFDDDTERAITQAMSIQDQPIYFFGVVDMLAQRRVDDIGRRAPGGV